jgi:hypothetical protein
VAFTFVDEIKELTDEFAAALLSVQFDGLEHWTVVFNKAVVGGNGTPNRKDVVAQRTILWVKVAEAWQKLHEISVLNGIQEGVGVC